MAEENKKQEDIYKRKTKKIKEIKKTKERIKTWGTEFIQCFGDKNIPSMHAGCLSNIELLLESLPSLSQEERRKCTLKLKEIPNGFKEIPSNWDAFSSTLRLIGYLSFIKPSQMDWRTGTWTDRALAVVCGMTHFFTRAIPNYIQFIPFRLLAIGLDGLNKLLQTQRSKNPIRWFIGGFFRLLFWPLRQILYRLANVIGYASNLLNSCLMLAFNTLRLVLKLIESMIRRLGPSFFLQEALPEWGKNLYNDVGNILKNSIRLAPEIAMTLAYVYAPPVAAAFDGAFHALHLSQAMYATLNYIGHNAVMAAPFINTCLASVLVSPASQLVTIGSEGSKSKIKNWLNRKKEIPPEPKIQGEEDNPQLCQQKVAGDNKSSSHQGILSKLPSEEIFTLTKEDVKHFKTYKDANELLDKINNNAGKYNRLDLIDELIYQCNFVIGEAKKDRESSHQEYKQKFIVKCTQYIKDLEEVQSKLKNEQDYDYAKDEFKKQNRKIALMKIIIPPRRTDENPALEEISKKILNYAFLRGYNALELIDELMDAESDKCSDYSNNLALVRLDLTFAERRLEKIEKMLINEENTIDEIELEMEKYASLNGISLLEVCDQLEANDGRVIGKNEREKYKEKLHAVYHRMVVFSKIEPSLPNRNNEIKRNVTPSTSLESHSSNTSDTPSPKSGRLSGSDQDSRERDESYSPSLSGN